MLVNTMDDKSDTDDLSLAAAYREGYIDATNSLGYNPSLKYNRDELYSYHSGHCDALYHQYRLIAQENDPTINCIDEQIRKEFFE